MELNQAIRKRRSIYTLSDKATVKEKEIVDFIDFALLNAPSAFNSQGARLVIAFGESHAKIWKIAKQELKKIVPAERFAATEEKINSFAKAFGTILYFEDTKVTQALQAEYLLYSAQFPVWAQQANGMLQYMIWTGLAAMGMGANLQHYNPLIDNEIAKAFNLPPNWKMVAQMPFGIASGEASSKEMIPPEQRRKVFY